MKANELIIKQGTFRYRPSLPGHLNDALSQNKTKQNKTKQNKNTSGTWIPQSQKTLSP